MRDCNCRRTQGLCQACRQELKLSPAKSWRDEDQVWRYSYRIRRANGFQ